MKTFRRALATLVLLLLALSAFAQNTVTVTGDYRDLFGADVAGASGQTFVRFRLENWTGNVPRVSGVGIIGKAKLQTDATPDATGHFSTTVYGNDSITPANTYYEVQFWQAGVLVTSGIYQFTQAACPSGCNLDTYAQLTPTGNGTFTVSSSISGGVTNNLLKASSSTTATDSGVAVSSVVQNGVDINSSNQVTATHLAAPLPIAQGGTGTTSTTGTGSVVFSASPALSGVPTAPTPATADNSTTVATTAYVKSSLAATGITGAVSGNLVKATGATSGSDSGMTVPWLDVVGKYGADPTGATDSTTAINNAIAACNGGTVFFPPGTYIHNSFINAATPCTLFAVPGTAVLKKNYNSGGGFPGGSGAFRITTSNFTLYGLNYNGNCNPSGGVCANFTGICIAASTNGASTISNITVDHVSITNCDADSLGFTSSSGYTTNGPTNVVVANSYIVCSATANGNSAIRIQGTVAKIRISNNYLDCSQTTNTSGPATIQFESQGLTTNISDLIINNNFIQCAGAGATSPGWCLQGGNYNAYALPGLIVTGNKLNLVDSTSTGIASFQGVVSASITGNEFDFNGVSNNYTALELIQDTGSNISSNSFNTENPGSAKAITCNMCNDTVISSNKVIGFGETGGGSNLAAGIAIDSSHNQQAVSGTGASLSESGNTVTIQLATGTQLPSWIQPPSTVCIVGATTTGYNICGMILNGSYNRANGTATMYNPTGALASCTGACLTSAFVDASESNVVMVGNDIKLPCQGTLTGTNRYGIMVRATGTGEQVNNNAINDNVINGCGTGASGDTGIGVVGTAVPTNLTIANNHLSNLAIGYKITQGTSIAVRGTDYNNVATQVSTSGATFAETDFLVPFASLVSCTAALNGKSAFVSDDTTALAFNATVAGGGSNKVRATCLGTAWVMQ